LFLRAAAALARVAPHGEVRERQFGHVRKLQPALCALCSGGAGGGAGALPPWGAPTLPSSSSSAAAAADGGGAHVAALVGHALLDVRELDGVGDLALPAADDVSAAEHVLSAAATWLADQGMLFRAVAPPLGIEAAGVPPMVGEPSAAAAAAGLLARAGKALGRPEWVELAERALGPTLAAAVPPEPCPSVVVDGLAAAHRAAGSAAAEAALVSRPFPSWNRFHVD
jgi:hypothetical protein